MKYFFDSNTIPTKPYEIIYLIILSLNEDNFFFNSKKIFLLITLLMYLCDCADIHFLNSKKKKQSRNFIDSQIFLIQRNFFLGVMHS